MRYLDMIPTKNKYQLALLFLLLAAAGSIGLAITIGVADISPRAAAEIIFSRLFGTAKGEWNAVWETIIWQMRLPRVLLAFLVGASLAIAGVAFQGLLQNPLADPYTIGVSSGAAVGATVAFLVPLDLSRSILIPLFGLAGALLALFIVYQMARAGGRIPVVTLLLAGVVVSSFLSAIISLLMILAGEDLRSIFFWLAGGFLLRGWPHVWLMLPYFVIGLLLLLIVSRDLNIILVGEETALTLGVDVPRVMKFVLLSASLITAAAVSVSGMIGFVGLIIPHAVRFITGPDHRILFPTSALVGGIFLIWMDVFARTVMAPAEIPVGIVTAFLGAPFFMYLLRRRRKNFGF